MIRLFAHAYAFHLNFRFGSFRPRDLLDWAALRNLQGVKIHVEDGGSQSLLAAPATRLPFAAKARALGLEVHVETSASDRATLAAAVAIARDTGATSVRFYPRHAGRLSEVLSRTAADLAALPDLDPEGRLDFLLEQHEDLKGAELAALVAAAGNPRLSLLFDFANMLNADETPEAALAAMAPHITDVHIKDAIAIPDRGGTGHRACATGQGDIDLAGLLVGLLLLGENRPQVRAFALEEEAGYTAPAFRIPGEGPDPMIAARAPSETDPGPGPLGPRLARERAEAEAQLTHIRALLAALTAALREDPAPPA